MIESNESKNANNVKGMSTQREPKQPSTTKKGKKKTKKPKTKKKNQLPTIDEMIAHNADIDTDNYFFGLKLKGQGEDINLSEFLHEQVIEERAFEKHVRSGGEAIFDPKYAKYVIKAD